MRQLRCLFHQTRHRAICRGWSGGCVQFRAANRATDILRVTGRWHLAGDVARWVRSGRRLHCGTGSRLGSNGQLEKRAAQRRPERAGARDTFLFSRRVGFSPIDALGRRIVSQMKETPRIHQLTCASWSRILRKHARSFRSRERWSWLGFTNWRFGGCGSKPEDAMGMCSAKGHLVDWR